MLHTRGGYFKWPWPTRFGRDAQVRHTTGSKGLVPMLRPILFDADERPTDAEWNDHTNRSRGCVSRTQALHPRGCPLGGVASHGFR